MNETIKLFDKIRSQKGFEIELLHDVHERISPRDAILFAKEMEAFKLFFLEDVLPIEQSEWMRQLRSQTAIPIAQGELYNNPSEWKFLIAERLIDFLRLHISQAGGITPARKAQLMAEEFGVRTAWHGSGDLTPIGHAANIHLDMASHNFGIQEWSGTEPPNFIIQDLKGPQGALTEVFSGLPEQRGAYVYPSDKPGHGVDIDEKEAAKYPIDSSAVAWTQTRLKDGTLQTP
jgi:mannonate dehydratase